MKNFYKFFLVMLFVPLFLLSLSGCIIFHKVSYIIKLDSPNSGTVTVIAYDMRSNAKSNQEFEQDKTNLFNYMWKSNDFVEAQKGQGKDITSRKLFIQDNKLIGEGIYRFNNIGAVEGIKFEGGFHYLNLSLDDSVMSTNGEIVMSKDYKRIMWDSTFKELNFTMFSFSFDKDKYRPLEPYFKNYDR